MGLSRTTAVEYRMSVADLPSGGVHGEGVNSIGEGVDVIHLPQFIIPRKPIGDGDVIKHPLATTPLQFEQGPHAGFVDCRREWVSVGHGAKPEPALRVTLAIVGSGVLNYRWTNLE